MSRSRPYYQEVEIPGCQVRYSRYNTEISSNNIKIIAQEKETMCALRCVIWVMLLWVAMSHCHDTDICFDAGASEKPIFYLYFIANVQTLLIFMQRQPLSTTFSLTIWGFDQYLVRFLSCESNSDVPCACALAPDTCTLRRHHSGPLPSGQRRTQGGTTENVTRIDHPAPCYNEC